LFYYYDLTKRVDDVEKLRIRRNFHKNGTFSCTPHQSASPRGEAFATAYPDDELEFNSHFQ